MLGKREPSRHGGLISALPGLWSALLVAGLLLVFGSSRASAVAIIADPFPTPAEAAQIASLVNQYLQAASGATTTGGWLDAGPSGNAPDRGQSLILPNGVVPIGPNLQGP